MRLLHSTAVTRHQCTTSQPAWCECAFMYMHRRVQSWFMASTAICSLLPVRCETQHLLHWSSLPDTFAYKNSACMLRASIRHAYEHAETSHSERLAC